MNSKTLSFFFVGLLVGIVAASAGFSWMLRKSTSNNNSVQVLKLAHTLDPKHLGQRTSSATVTAPLIGGRFGIDLSPDWFVMADGNLGGFGADNISFTGTLQGLVGYRFLVGGMPGSVELGYRALRISTEPNPRMETNTTLNGPFAGFTAHW